MTEERPALDLKLPPDDAEVDQLLHPSRFYARPSDVIADDLLTIEERRAILSSWASDVAPLRRTLRLPPFAQVMVTFDEIMDALAHLDHIKSSMLTPVTNRGRSQKGSYFSTARACCTDVNEVAEYVTEDEF